MNKLPLLSILAPLTVVACTSASAPPPQAMAPSSVIAPPPVAVAPASSESSKPAAPRAVYRLDFTLKVTESGKAPNETAYQLTVQDNDLAEIRTGDNVPLTVAAPVPAAKGATPPPATLVRQDVGVALKASLNTRAANEVLLRVDLESSAIAANNVIHKTVMHGDALVVPGKATVVAASEDATTKEKYELIVVATAL